MCLDKMQNYTVFFLLVLTGSFTNGQNDKKQGKKKSFVDYLAKYNPRDVWERIDKEQKLKGNLSDAEFVNAMFAGMDVTDELLKIKVQNGDARIAIRDTRRKFWQPPKGLDIYPLDVFSIRARLYELMKQAIYQTRNKMIIMQDIRAKYRNSSLYKMGYLMSKTDNACKTFSKFAFRTYKICHMARQQLATRVYLYDLLICEERLLFLWFTVDLLVDVLNKNDLICRDVLEKHETKRIKNWKFED